MGTIALLMLACQSSKIELGGGPETDARFMADVYTWSCQVDDGYGNLTNWEGVFDYNLSLQHAPDALPALELPASGCNAGADLYPTDAE